MNLSIGIFCCVQITKYGNFSRIETDILVIMELIMIWRFFYFVVVVIIFCIEFPDVVLVAADIKFDLLLWMEVL